MNKNDIANLATSNLGQTIKIVDFTTDSSLAAKIINQWWRTALIAYLESHPWTFATSFAALPTGLSTASAGYSYAYTKPADALVIRRLAPNGCFPKAEIQQEYALRWREVNVGTGTEIWCDVAEAHAEYTVAIGDDYDFPYHFAIGFSFFLAKLIGPKLITQNWPKIFQNIMPDYKAEIQNAIARDISHQPESYTYDSSFITVRGGC